MKALLATLGLAAVLTGCSGTSSDPAVENNERTTGNPAVIARIENSTSCTGLQREFNTAMDNAEARQPGDPMRDLSMTYARAADNRMEEVGCYG